VIRLIIPAYDEAPNIERLFEGVRAVAAAQPTRIYFVDDGSSDGTASLAESAGSGLDVRYLRHDQNRGLGAALKTGLEAALEEAEDDEPLVTLESDTTSDLSDLPAMLARFDSGFDLVLASVHAKGGQLIGVARWRVLASRGVSMSVRLVAPGVRKVHTVSAVYRVYRAAALRRALAAYGDELIRERGFAVNLELLLKLTSTGSSVCEVPTTNDWTQRGGESKLQTGQTLRAYFRVMRAHRENRRLRTPLLLPDPGPTR